jgi:NADP-dependent 3-hydroxy acid dehydrogenase YdfG
LVSKDIIQVESARKFGVEAYYLLEEFDRVKEKIEVMNEINKIGQQAIYIQADVSDPDQVEEMIEREIRLRE